MFKRSVIAILLTCSFQLLSNIRTNVALLEECLMSDWGIDEHSAHWIARKLQTTLDDSNSSHVIEEFIAKLAALKIDFSCIKEPKALHPQDAVLQAPEHHLIVFESPYVRILYGSTKPGERENLHRHSWRSIIIVMRGTTYRVDYPDGRSEIGEWPVGAYELPPNEYYSCTNIGPSADECLRFEIKD